MKTETYYKGYESKVAEIKEMGWKASRDKFNLDYTPGKPWEGTTQGLEYAQGEFKAICECQNKIALQIRRGIRPEGV